MRSLLWILLVMLMPVAPLLAQNMGGEDDEEKPKGKIELISFIVVSGSEKGKVYTSKNLDEFSGECKVDFLGRVVHDEQDVTKVTVNDEAAKIIYTKIDAKTLKLNRRDIQFIVRGLELDSEWEFAIVATPKDGDDLEQTYPVNLMEEASADPDKKIAGATDDRKQFDKNQPSDTITYQKAVLVAFHGTLGAFIIFAIFGLLLQVLLLFGGGRKKAASAETPQLTTEIPDSLQETPEPEIDTVCDD